MVQKLEQAQESLAKFEGSFMSLTSKHEDLKAQFAEQGVALNREREAREDAQECESQLRILLEDEADKKGSTRDQLDKAKEQIKQLEADLEESKRAEGLARADCNLAMDDLDLERTAHGGTRAHLDHTTGSLKTMQTIEGALRAEIAAARAQIDALSEDKSALLGTMGVLQDKVGYIIGWLNRGQRVGKQRAQEEEDDGGSLVSPGTEAPAPSPRGSKVRVFKHSANLVEVERSGLLKELAVVLSLVTRDTEENRAPTDEEIQAMVRAARTASPAAFPP
jgi:chromosome segregation ATPase